MRLLPLSPPISDPHTLGNLVTIPSVLFTCLSLKSRKMAHEGLSAGNGPLSYFRAQGIMKSLCWLDEKDDSKVRQSKVDTESM